jgi:hypothetical protein
MFALILTCAGAASAFAMPTRTASAPPDSRRSAHYAFLVGYTIDYGYRLYAPGEPSGDEIIPDLSDANALKSFNDFFGGESLARSVGKRVMCDCVGYGFVRDGANHFKVQSARIYAD